MCLHLHECFLICVAELDDTFEISFNSWTITRVHVDKVIDEPLLLGGGEHVEVPESVR